MFHHLNHLLHCQSHILRHPHEGMVVIRHRAFESFNQFGVVLFLYHRYRIWMYNLLEMMDDLFSRIGILSLNPIPNFLLDL